MKDFKILFQEPFVPRQVIYGKFSDGTGNNTFPFGVASVASYVHGRGYHVSYIDPLVDEIKKEDYLAFLRENRFDMIAMSSTTLEIDYAVSTLELAKSVLPDCLTVLGGVHATLLPEKILRRTDAIDYLVLGEGEKSFLRLLDALSSGREGLTRGLPGIAYKKDGAVTVNPYEETDRLSPEEMPAPLFDIFPMRKYVSQITYAKVFPTYSLVASRGCPYECAFCDAPVTTGRKVRYKPVDALISEISTLKEKYGARGVMFLDSTFTVDNGWVTRFCEAYIRSGLKLPWACNSRVDTVSEGLLKLMKKAGCWSVLFGVESANQKSLDLINKRTTVEQNEASIRLALKLGFYVYTSYILCLPGENEDDVMNTIRFARRMGNHIAIFYLPVPFPRTKLEEIARAEGGLREGARGKDYNQWDYSDPVYINPLLGKEKMQELLRKAFLGFYTSPLVISRNLKELFLLRQSPYKFYLGLKGVLGVFK